MKNLFLVLVLLFSAQVHAQIETPEEYILNTFKSGNVAKELASMVRYNCVQKYIKQVEGQAQEIDTKLFAQSTMTYLPASWTNVPSIAGQPRIQMELKNDSRFTIITAFIQVTNKTSGQKATYRLTADNPVKPAELGLLVGQAPAVSKPEEFWKDNTWFFIAVGGVPQ
jgi:hypothetical protein